MILAAIPSPPLVAWPDDSDSPSCCWCWGGGGGGGGVGVDDSVREGGGAMAAPPVAVDAQTTQKAHKLSLVL